MSKADAEAAIGNAVELSPERVSADDIADAVLQLVEAAVRALSPGIDDPHTALSSLDRLGAALRDLVPLRSVEPWPNRGRAATATEPNLPQRDRSPSGTI